MSSKKLNIFIDNLDDPSCMPDLIREIRAITPNAHIIKYQDLKNDPSLIESVEIVFGHLDHRLFPRASCLKWVQSPGVGVDWADHPEAKSHSFTLTNAHTVEVSISEHLFAMLLLLTRRLRSAYCQQLKRVWQESTLLEGMETIKGKTLCVVGLGYVGKRCAMLGKAHQMHVIGVRNHPQPTEWVDRVYGPNELKEALSQADVVMVVIPNTNNTRNLIASEEFAVMPKGSYLLNAGRGQTVDTDALVKALINGTIKGAGLDVINPEPPPPGHPIWQIPNVIITPHLSSWYPRYQEDLNAVFLDNLSRYVNHKALKSLVNRREGY